MKRGFRRVTVARLVLGGFVSIALYAQGQVVAPPTPGVVAGGFCTYRTGFFKTSTQAAQRINQYFAAGAVGSEIFHVGDPSAYAYTWRKTGTTVSVGKEKTRCRSTPASRRCSRRWVQADFRARSPKAQPIRPTWERAASLPLRHWL